MKKSWAGIMALGLLLCLLAGCKTSGIGENINSTIADWQPESTVEGHKEPSEIVPLDSPDFTDPLGFSLTSYPDEDGLHPYKFFAIDQWFAQVEYQAGEERTLVLRIASLQREPLTSTYKERHNAKAEEREVDGTPVRVRLSSGGCTAVSWERDNFQFLLHSNRRYAQLTDEEIETMVKGLACTFTQPASSSSQ